MNTVTKILKVLFKIVWEVVKVLLKIIKVMVVLFFSIFMGTKLSHKWQYDAEYYGYE